MLRTISAAQARYPMAFAAAQLRNPGLGRQADHAGVAQRVQPGPVQPGPGVAVVAELGDHFVAP
jgi:hypothetical protein